MDRQDDGNLETRRSSNQLLVDKAGRKPLFASANSRDERARDGEQSQPRQIGSSRYRPPIDGLMNRSRSDGPPPSALRNGHHTAGYTPSGSRLPQAKGSSVSQRRPLTMSEAFKLAEQEEGTSGGDDGPIDGSPSPAPRNWRSRFNDQMKATEAGRELAKVTRGEQHGTGDSRPQAQTRRSQDQFDLGDGEVAIPPLVPGIEDSPFPSPAAREALGSPMRRHSAIDSPQKSFAWDIDQDFTAGDLQVSDSPRIRVDGRPFANRRVFNDESGFDADSPAQLPPQGIQKTKLDEIQALERRVGEMNSSVFVSPRKNTKLDEIAALETSADLEIPIPDRRLSTPKNSKLSEIQQRELEGLSKRQLASIRLGEIREQNSMARAKSEETKPRLDDFPRETGTEPQAEGGRYVRPRSGYEAARETSTNPITSYKNRHNGTREISRSLEDKNWRTSAEPVRPTMPHSRKGSTDALRQTGKTAGNSPGQTATARRSGSNTTSEKTSDSSETKSRIAKRAAARAARKQNKEKDGENKRLTVGFAGLKRVQSTESTNSKRSSLHSEPDPTERLEAELKLFAPTDNHSEPGSVRAQSPVSDSDDEKMAEATPKPKRQDPMMMPTPKVTGAYVETPATVRVDKVVLEEDSKPVKTSAMEAENFEDFRPARLKLSDRKRSNSWSTNDRDVSSDPGATESQSADEKPVVRKPRARSLPRRRLPVRNSTKIPSVKDDLLELHRLHNVEDSTLDDLEEILTGQKAPSSEKVEEILDEVEQILPTKAETPSEDNKPSVQEDEALSRQTKHASKAIKSEDRGVEDLAAYDRMDKRLQTAALGIRDAKKGIESLEDRFTSSQSEKTSAMDYKTHTPGHRDCPACTERPDASALAYIQIPVPRLFHLKPTFRFTLLGLILFTISAWYATESVMCANFCRPTTCDPSTGPCVWSFDDPTSFGTALPIKVDQWITGGYGRKRFEQVYEILDDARADLVDAALGRHITDVDVNSLLTPEQRRQHRRRLRNKGLVKRRNLEAAPPEEKAKWAAWHRARVESEKAQEAREMGYTWEDEDEGSVGGDAPVYW